MMKTIKLIAQYIYYLLVLLIYLSRAAHWGFSHDENQFIAAGQLLSDHGLFPYVNYPYTHMPYGALFFAITARISNYDYLAGRVLNAVACVVCCLLIVYIFKLFVGTRYTVALLIWEFVIVFIFLNHPSMVLIAGEVLNHSLASLFSLLALMFFIHFVQQRYSPDWAAFGCGVCVCLATFIRFNYASLIVVLFFLFWMYKWILNPPRFLKSFQSFIAGLLTAALPALVLIFLAPYSFYYGNLVYTRLNTLYYQELHFKMNMDLGSKISGFLSNTVSSPLNFILYALLVFVGITSFVLFIRKKSPTDLNILAVATFAFTLFLTAFAPTPTQQQYFFAPVPFLVIILAIVGSEIYRINKPVFYILILGMLIALNPKPDVTNPLDELKYLSNPSQWTPLQVHDFAEEIKRYVPKGRILTLIPMIPLEAGYDIYPFTVTGPFSWRTSLLLSSQGRARYDVISPKELAALLNQYPPDGILTGFEAPNAGFTNDDPGTVETPFIDYANNNGYRPIILPASFVQRPITLWVKGP
jgi:hypothetical protein